MKLIISISFLIVFTSSAFTQKSAQEHRDSGLKKHIQENYIGAIKDFDKAIQIDPKDCFTYKIKGRALNELGKWSEAINSFNLALKNVPNDYQDIFFKGETYYLRGIARYENGDKDGGCNDWLEADKNGFSIASNLTYKYCK